MVPQKWRGAPALSAHIPVSATTDSAPLTSTAATYPLRGSPAAPPLSAMLDVGGGAIDDRGDLAHLLGIERAAAKPD